MVELSSECGYEGVTVRSVTRLAGVSTRTFYKHFGNAEECFLDTYRWLMRCGLRRAYAAQTGIEAWEQAIRASLRTIVADLAKDPKAAWLVLVEGFAVGPDVQGGMREEIAGFEQLLIDSFAGAPPQVAPPREIVAGIAAGVMRVLRTSLLREESADVDELAGQLGDWVLSFPRTYAPALESLDREPFGSVRGNGGAPREGAGPAIAGGPGDEEGRMLSAAAKLGAANGFSNLTIPRIRAEAGVSRRSFDARFASAGECFLEAIETIVSSAAARAERDARGAPDWESRTCTGTEALCTEVARNATLARLAFVEIFAPGREGLQRRERLITRGADCLRRTAPPHRQPSGLVAEASVAAAWRIAHTEIAAGRPADVGRLAPVISYVTLAPAIGAPTAAEAIGSAGRVRVG